MGAKKMMIGMSTTILVLVEAVAMNGRMWAQACPYECAGEGLLADAGRVSVTSDRITKQHLANTSKDQKIKTYT
jgi:hypothetical protein